MSQTSICGKLCHRPSLRVFVKDFAVFDDFKSQQGRGLVENDHIGVFSA